MPAAVVGLVLDSSVLIAAERKLLSARSLGGAILRIHGPVGTSLSVITVTELVHGVYRAKTPAVAQRRRRYIEELVSTIPVHPVTTSTAWLVGEIEGREGAKGNVLPPSDLLIAAAALEQGYAILTGNVRHFQRIPGLDVLPFEPVQLES